MAENDNVEFRISDILTVNPDAFAGAMIDIGKAVQKAVLKYGLDHPDVMAVMLGYAGIALKAWGRDDSEEERETLRLIADAVLDSAAGDDLVGNDRGR